MIGVYPPREFRSPTRRCVTVAFLAFLMAFPAFAQDPDPPLSVDEVGFTGSPLNGDTYGPGEEIRAYVVLSKPVTVTGDPGLALQVGDQTRVADLYSVSGSGARLNFRYFVKALDRDDDGTLTIPANAVRLNGGAIRDLLGNDADLTHEEYREYGKVNGRLDAVPTIVGVAWSGALPQAGSTYGRGEMLLARVRFSELIEVTGTPQLTLQVGTQPRQGDLHSRQDSSLYFTYFVQSSDVDTDGISVPANALTLNGGSIRDADGNGADLTHAALRDDPERRVNGEPAAPPAVRAVRFFPPPVSQDTYEAGETIIATVTFTQGVHVTGTPQLTLEVGPEVRRANHYPRVYAAALLAPGNSFHLPGDEDRLVYFRYVVQPSDVDDDGISVPANALSLNGGSIRAVNDNSEADLNHDGLPDDPTLKVDGNRADAHGPAVGRLVVRPAVHGGRFRPADAITVELGWNERVTVTGAPRFALRIGAETRFATFSGHWATRSLVFEYIVEESDRDDDGISIAADAVDLNGGTIQDNAGNDANLDLGYFAFSDDPDLKVNGRLTPVPALPLGGAIALLLALLGSGWRRLAWQRDGRGS